MSNRSRNTVEIETIAEYMTRNSADAVWAGMHLIAKDSAAGPKGYILWPFTATNGQIAAAKRVAAEWAAEYGLMTR